MDRGNLLRFLLDSHLPSGCNLKRLESADELFKAFQAFDPVSVYEILIRLRGLRKPLAFPYFGPFDKLQY